jgi:hypothetical protein
VIWFTVETVNARPSRKSPWGPKTIQRAARASETRVIATFRRRMSFDNGCDDNGTLSEGCLATMFVVD